MTRCAGVRCRLLVASTLLCAAVIAGESSEVRAAPCARSSASWALEDFFTADDAAGLSAGDYPRAQPLPDGRVLWTFQDAFLGSDATLWTDEFRHNLGIVQTGNCFTILANPEGSSGSWVGSGLESPLRRWFWPLDAEMGADGHLWLFLAEMKNPRGTGAAPGAVPVATWRARIELPELRIIDLTPATDASADLFGYSIVSDAAWTYMYGHCHRQFVPQAHHGFDPECSPHAFVARVPKGQFDAALEYWSANGWTTAKTAKVPVITGTESGPVSVQKFRDVYVNASDEGDWWGSNIVIKTARRPEGPWTVVKTFAVPTKCGKQCNTYGAFVMPQLERGRVVIAYSNNSWNMRPAAFDNAELYRISFTAVHVPGIAAGDSIAPRGQTRVFTS